MKIVVLSSVVKQQHIDQINSVADKYGASICYIGSEGDLPDDFADPDIVYGFGMGIAKTCKNLKWLCVPSAGVDYLMKPDAFANPDCILTNSSGSYGVTIAEHIIAVSMFLMRRLTDYY